MTQAEWYGGGAELPEPSLDEAIAFASDMAILEADDEPGDPFRDDPITLYRTGASDDVA